MANKASLTFSFRHNSLQVGQYVELRLFGNVVRFTGATVTDTANRQFKVTSGAGPAAIALQQIIQDYIAASGAGKYTVEYFQEGDGPSSENPDGYWIYIFVVQATELGSAYNFTGSTVSGTTWVIGYTDSRAEFLSATYTTSLVKCFSGSSGAIAVTVTGGEGPFTFLWADGPTTKDRDLLPAGTYQLLIKDGTGQDYSLTAEVGQNPRIEVQVIKGDGTLALNVSGGVAPYTYLWEDGSTGSSRENVSYGEYSCIVTDSLGCQVEVPINFDKERFFFSRNPVTLELEADELELKPNLTFLCEVWLEKVYLSGNFEKITEDPLEHPADSDGKTIFNVRRLLDAYLEPHFPEFKQNTISRADSCFKRFYLKHTEKFGNPPVPSSFSQIDYRYVLIGGLDWPEHYAQTYFESYLPQRQPFFTWDLPTKAVFPDQPEYLYFMPLSMLTTSFTVKAKVNYRGEAPVTYDLFTQENINRFELYCVPAGHDLLDLAGKRPGSTILGWDIYVVDQAGTQISETRRYELDQRYFRQKRYLLYTNSIGGINTIAALGEGKSKLDPDVQQLERIITPDFNPARGEVAITDKYLKPSLELTTGYRTRKEIASLTDFVLAREARLFGRDRYQAGTFVAKNVVLDDESEDFNYIDFEFMLAKQYNYTPQLKLAGYLDETPTTDPREPW
ncbi:SprB repeat-containing protein [Adhaeribacter swui]|uniref:SprB repeat-containing protein n=1 Tax=Adhaeribacter swui TaxID=2086471 RepID=A0A7G7GB35_9BACT|nr:SprB repeat-containing protein [Adhaeribacter swui]QNF34369.1 SprB repeat-containing protein [Adhaeribacter swui]